MLDIKASRVYQNILLIGLGLYLLAGIKTDFIFFFNGNFISQPLYDFGYYERALHAALAGSDPYSIRNVGFGYFYPPPALLIVELFHSLRPFYLKMLTYSVFNVALLIFIINRVATHYGLSFKETWAWYVLGLGFAPLHELLLAGQINIVTLFGIALFFLWPEIPTLSGGGWALAILTKVSPIVLVGNVLVTKNYKLLAAALIWIIIATGLSIFRYGLFPLMTYPEVFGWLSHQFPVDLGSQSFVAKMAMVFGAALPRSGYQLIQIGLMLYIFLVIVASLGLSIGGKQPREPLFILSVFGMTILPNVMWYHHYVFLLLPILIWLGWRRLDVRLATWCLMGLIIIQTDRFYLTSGLLIHLFVHLSILAILVWQIRQFYSQRQPARSFLLGKRSTQRASEAIVE